jgi:hypothetical protein
LIFKLPVRNNLAPIIRRGVILNSSSIRLIAKTGWAGCSVYFIA